MKEKLEKEIIRADELLKMYEEIPTGFFGAGVIRGTIKLAKSALERGNKTMQKEYLSQLKEFEG